MDTMATHDDANLILRLYELRRDPKMRDARNWFVPNFYAKTVAESMALCPPDSEENAYVRMITSYWEMAASFITSGLLNEELFFQSGQEMLLTWLRVRSIIPEMRTMFGNPSYMKNFEAVSERYIEYWNRTAPGAYEAFVKRMADAPAVPAEKV